MKYWESCSPVLCLRGLNPTFYFGGVVSRTKKSHTLRPSYQHSQNQQKEKRADSHRLRASYETCINMARSHILAQQESNGNNNAYLSRFTKPHEDDFNQSPIWRFRPTGLIVWPITTLTQKNSKHISKGLSLGQTHRQYRPTWSNNKLNVPSGDTVGWDGIMMFVSVSELIASTKVSKETRPDSKCPDFS